MAVPAASLRPADEGGAGDGWVRSPGCSPPASPAARPRSWPGTVSRAGAPPQRDDVRGMTPTEQAPASPDTELVSLAAVEHAVKETIRGISSPYVRNECWRAYLGAIPEARTTDPTAMPWEDASKAKFASPEAIVAVCTHVVSQVPDGPERHRVQDIMVRELDTAERMFPVTAGTGSTYCANCGRRFDARPGQRYCRTTCRTSAFRKRSKANEGSPRRVPA